MLADTPHRFCVVALLIGGVFQKGLASVAWSGVPSCWRRESTERLEVKADGATESFFGKGRQVSCRTRVVNEKV